MASAYRAPSLKDRQRRERQELILRAAAGLLAERSYHDMSLDEIAARVGISKGTIYLHFTSKEDLMIALFERGIFAFQNMLDEVTKGSALPSEKLATIIERVTRGMIADPGAQCMSAIAQNPEFVARLAEHHNEMRPICDDLRERIAQLINEGKATGEFDPSLPTPLLLSLFTSLLSPHTARQLAKVGGMTTEEIAEGLSRFFFKGIASLEHTLPTAASHGP